MEAICLQYFYTFPYVAKFFIYFLVAIAGFTNLNIVFASFTHLLTSMEVIYVYPRCHNSNCSKIKKHAI